MLRADGLIHTLGLVAHPEGGWYREVFRSLVQVLPGDDRPSRSALTSIDFLLKRGQHSAWHRVRSDEAWHLLEGGPLCLWLLPPGSGCLQRVELSAAGSRRHFVPADCWQAAEPLGAYAYVGATVGPGFEFADFSFGRDDPALRLMLQQHAPDLQRLL